MVGTCKVVVIFFVIKRPVLGVGNCCSGSHVLAHFLWVVEKLRLNSVMVPMFSGVERPIVVFVPMLVVRAAHEWSVMSERNDCPVLSENCITCSLHAR